MSFFDDLAARAQQAVGPALDALSSRAAAELVKVASPRTGNLSAAEIAAGARGAPPAMQAQAQAQAAQVKAAAISLPLVGLVAIAAYFMMKRRRG